MYVKISEGITAKELIRLSKNSDGNNGKIIDSTWENAKVKIKTSGYGNDVNVEEEIQKLIDSNNYKFIGEFYSTTGVRGYYHHYILAK